MANRTIQTGRLVADPELRQTQGGISVTKFRIAVPRRFSKEDAVDFFDVEAWRAAAEFVCKYFTKGKLIEIDGHLETFRGICFRASIPSMYSIMSKASYLRWYAVLIGIFWVKS